MARKDEPFKSPFENLGAPAINRRFVTADPPKRVVAPKVEKAKAVLAKAERAAKPLATPKPKKPAAGRPKKLDDPWKAEGISRAAWYRKNKGESA